jgi:hypothetical protein
MDIAKTKKWVLIANGFEFYDIAVYLVIQTYVTSVFFLKQLLGTMVTCWLGCLLSWRGSVGYTKINL